MKLNLLTSRRSTLACVVCAALLTWLASSCKSDEGQRDQASPTVNSSANSSANSTANSTAGPAAPKAATVEAAGPSGPSKLAVKPAGTTTWSSYGAGVSTAANVSSLVPLEKVLADPRAYAGKRFVLEGPVENVCPKKGCWMIMSSGGREMRVTFKDYGFFVPMDIHGRTARMEGKFDITETSVADARHYLEDAGQHEQAMKITEPVMTYAFVADGVAIAR